MTPEQLKASILQYAIQGKLVPQDPSEGTGEELYQQIQEEKQRLIKEGKIKKGKQLAEIAENEIPFDIPESWKWVRLGNCINLLSGQDLTSDRYNSKNEGIVYLTGASNIDDDDEIIINRWTTSPTSVAHKGDLLLTCKGTIGKTSILDIEEAHIARQIMAISAVLIDLKYLKYFVTISIEELQRKAKSMIPGIDRDTVKGLAFPLPPLAEQHRIVAKIEELLPYVDRYAAAYEKLEQFNASFPKDMKKSVLQYAIQGKLVPQDPSEGTGEELYQQIQEEKQSLIKEGKLKKGKPLADIAEDEVPFDIPESWKWVRVQSVVTLNPKNELDDAADAGFIPMTLVSDGFRNLHSFEVKKWGDIKKGFSHFADGDIGVAKITPCFQNRKSVIFRNLPNGCGAGTTELTISRVIGETLNREYLLWFFKTSYFIENGVKSFTGTAGQQRIHKDYLANCLLPLPPLAEQHRIVAKLEEILPLCDKLK